MAMVCRRCGYEFDARRFRRSDGSVRCPDCGAVYRPQGAPRRGQGALPARSSVRNEGPRARRGRAASPLARRLWKLPVWAWLALLAVILLIGAGSGGSRRAAVRSASVSSGEVQAPAAAPAEVSQAAPAAAQSEPGGVSIGQSADFGSAKVEVVGATIRTVGGDSYVICEYNWTNSSGENEMFLSQISEHVFQNGVGLEDGYLFDVETNAITEVMPGYSLAVRTVHKLSDPAAEVMFSVEPLLDFADAYAPLTFTVNPA